MSENLIIALNRKNDELRAQVVALGRELREGKSLVNAARLAGGGKRMASKLAAWAGRSDAPDKLATFANGVGYIDRARDAEARVMKLEAEVKVLKTKCEVVVGKGAMS